MVREEGERFVEDGRIDAFGLAQWFYASIILTAASGIAITLNAIGVGWARLVDGMFTFFARLAETPFEYWENWWRAAWEGPHQVIALDLGPLGFAVGILTVVVTAWAAVLMVRSVQFLTIGLGRR